MECVVSDGASVAVVAGLLWCVVMESTSSILPWHYETRALAVLKSLCGRLTRQSECGDVGGGDDDGSDVMCL